MAIPRGRAFHKMSGSGNDFVVFDARREPPGALASPEAIRAMSARGTGIGADGVVFLEASPAADFRMTYYNSDGSRASFCGNAALCSTRLATELGAGSPAGMTFDSDAGLIHSRISDGLPEFDLPPVTDVRPEAGIPLEEGEQRMGFALAGVPHLVVLCHDIERVDLATRGKALRWHPSVAPAGANANFVSRTADGWSMRTFERGVEGETLACGTGAIATAVLLATWGLSSAETALRTRSGRTLRVRLERAPNGAWKPSLGGEGRIVYEGSLGEI